MERECSDANAIALVSATRGLAPPQTQYPMHHVSCRNPRTGGRSVRSYSVLVSLATAIVAITIGSSPSPVAAETVRVSTLEKPGGVWANVAFNVSEGFGFATDESEYRLQDITVSLQANGSGSLAGIIVGDLYYCGTDGRPVGPSLGKFAPVTPISLTVSPVVFRSAAPLRLAAFTKYLFALSTAPTSDAAWMVEFTETTNGYDRPSGGDWIMHGGRNYWSDGNWGFDSFYRVRASVGAAALPGHPHPCLRGLIELSPASANSDSVAVNERGQVLVNADRWDDFTTRPLIFDHGCWDDLGTLGGMSAVGAVINNRGEVAGTLRPAGSIESRLFISSNGVMRDLGIPAGWNSCDITGMNERGDIVGFLNDPDFVRYGAFLYANGVLRELAGFGGKITFGNAVGSSGQVVGSSSFPGDLVTHAFLYGDGVMRDLGTLGGDYSEASAINRRGQIAGDSAIAGGQEVHAFLYDRGVMHDLGLPPGWSYATSRFMNDRGDVTGLLISSDRPDIHGFFYSNGAIREIQLPAGWTHSFVNAINERGEVVGNLVSSDFMQMHAFIYADGHLQDLNDTCADLLSDGTAPGFLTLTNAKAINDAGVIVGSGIYWDNSTQGFVLDLRGHELRGAGL
jgi:probable HAF family extracellular repeat protein